ncbi:hypothetical protein AKO1_000702, partial [Acrasis kona]
QKHFQNIHTNLANKTIFDDFVCIVQETLNTFDTEDDEVTQEQDDESLVTSQQDDSSFIPKYLTNRKLLHLQFKDHKFRRQIMLQMLIVFHNLDLTSSSSSHKLTLEQSLTISPLKEKILRILSKSPNQQHLNVINTSLNRERHWIDWKRNKCNYTFEADPSSLHQIHQSIAKSTRESNQRTKAQMAPDASYLDLFSNISKNQVHDKLKSTKVPTFKEYVIDKVVEQSDPDAGFEKEYKLVNNSVFKWKAMRATCKHYLSNVNVTFKSTTTGGNANGQQDDHVENRNEFDFEKIILDIYNKPNTKEATPPPPPLPQQQEEEEDEEEEKHSANGNGGTPTPMVQQSSPIVQNDQKNNISIDDEDALIQQMVDQSAEMVSTPNSSHHHHHLHQENSFMEPETPSSARSIDSHHSYQDLENVNSSNQIKRLGGNNNQKRKGNNKRRRSDYEQSGGGGGDFNHHHHHHDQSMPYNSDNHSNQWNKNNGGYDPRKKRKENEEDRRRGNASNNNNNNRH